MTPRPLPSEVQRLIEEHVDSFEKLEILAALDRMADRQAAKVALAAAVQLPPDVMKECVAELENSGLVVVTADSLVRLDTSDATRAITDLLQLYEHDRLAVISALSAISMERIRGMAARAFARAFDLRKKTKGDPDG